MAALAAVVLARVAVRGLRRISVYALCTYAS